MLRRKAIIAILFVFILLMSFGGYLAYRSTRHILDWSVSSVSERFQYYINGRMEPNCLEVKICVTNLTASDVCIDWNRDESEFKINGVWVKSDVTAGMAYIGPHDSVVFPTYVPRTTQAIRYKFNYEDSPLWSTANDFLLVHNLHFFDGRLDILMKYNRKIPAHWNQLNIEASLLDLNKTNSTDGKF
jgi:hypothetical protein